MFIVSHISSYESISVVMPDPEIFFSIPACVADAAPVNPNHIKVVLVDGLSTFFIKGKTVLVIVLKLYIKVPLIVLFYYFMRFSF